MWAFKICIIHCIHKTGKNIPRVFHKKMMPEASNIYSGRDNSRFDPYGVADSDAHFTTNVASLRDAGFQDLYYQLYP